MSSEGLFSNNSVRVSSKNLVEFKAGKMTMKGKTVYPDTRKGQLYVYQAEDGLMHFCWKDRTTGIVEDDLIIFPDDFEFKHVPQCKTGRVYLLRFKTSSKKFFIWLQDLKTDKDEEHCRKINEVLNNPPTPSSQRSSTANHEAELQNLLSNMSQQQLMQLFGSVGQMGGLGTLLGTMNRPKGVQTAKASTTTASSTPVTSSVTRPATTQTQPTASSTLTDSTKSSSNKPSTRTQAQTGSSSGLTSTSGSNKIQLSDLQNFLSGIPTPAGAEPANQSGQAGPVLRQFGLGDNAVAAASTGNIEEFVHALETEARTQVQQLQQDSQKQQEPQKQQEESKTAEEQEKKDKKDDDDEGMALD